MSELTQFKLGEQCNHGQLARQCELCDLERERDAWKSLSITAIAAENLSVMEYVAQIERERDELRDKLVELEERCEIAETNNANDNIAFNMLRKEYAELEAKLAAAEKNAAQACERGELMTKRVRCLHNKYFKFCHAVGLYGAKSFEEWLDAIDAEVAKERA